LGSVVAFSKIEKFNIANCWPPGQVVDMARYICFSVGRGLIMQHMEAIFNSKNDMFRIRLADSCRFYIGERRSGELALKEVYWQSPVIDFDPEKNAKNWIDRSRIIIS